MSDKKFIDSLTLNEVYTLVIDALYSETEKLRNELYSQLEVYNTEIDVLHHRIDKIPIKGK